MYSSVVVIDSFGNKCQGSGRATDFGVSNIFTAWWRHELGKYCIRRQQVTKLQTRQVHSVQFFYIFRDKISNIVCIIVSYIVLYYKQSVIVASLLLKGRPSIQTISKKLDRSLSEWKGGSIHFVVLTCDSSVLSPLLSTRTIVTFKIKN